MHILLFTCSITRAAHLEILPNQSTKDFIMTLKRLIARRGRASIIHSRQSNNFVAASEWVSKINKDKKMQECLIKEKIK